MKMANSMAENRTGGYADLFLTTLCWSFVGFFTRSNTCSAWLTSAVASLSGLLFLLIVVRPTLRFTGRAVLDDGTIVEVKDFPGFAEKVENKW